MPEAKHRAHPDSAPSSAQSFSSKECVVGLPQLPSHVYWTCMLRDVTSKQRDGRVPSVDVIVSLRVARVWYR